jgi:hypothetical protein
VGVALDSGVGGFKLTPAETRERQDRSGFCLAFASGDCKARCCRPVARGSGSVLSAKRKHRGVDPRVCFEGNLDWAQTQSAWSTRFGLGIRWSMLRSFLQKANGFVSTTLQFENA